MRIAVDANEAFRPELVGFGVYARHLVQNLRALAPTEELVFLGIRSEPFGAEPEGSGNIVMLRSLAYRSAWSQLRLPLHLWRHRYDLFHSLEHKLPRASFCPTIVTIHDLAFLKFPETTRSAHRQRFVWFTRDAIRRATRIIAISESTKRDICQIFNASPDRIDVVYHGVDHSVYRPEAMRSRRSVPYLLTVGTLQPRKNFGMLMRAFNRLCSRWPQRIELLIIGKRGWMWEGIEQQARTGPYADRIHLLGYVPDEQMPSMYAGAALFVMPSLYEGFGMPPLEAMACGVPVVAANESSLPEVLGNAAMFLDPHDEGAWAEGIQRLLNNPQEAATLRRDGFVQAAKYSWERTARETLNVYRKTLNGSAKKRT